ncbi:MAG: hypothetical protein ACXAB7_13320 [Candidatus Kariarchaeaceae archaeon]|jgi:hypothetical protein
MTKYIVELLPQDIWTTIFVTCFFFGLFFILFVLLGALGHQDDSDSHDMDETALDADHDIDSDFDIDHDLDTDVDMDSDLDLDHDLDTDFDTDVDMSADLDHDFDLDADGDLHADFDSDLDHDFDTDVSADLDHDLDGVDADHDFQTDFDHDIDTHIEIEQGEFGYDNESYIEESRYLMGNIAVFLLVWGQIGWITSNNLSDITLAIAFGSALLASRGFAWFISNYAKTVINPIRHISRGDIGRVIYGVNPYKPGMVQVIRKDGIVSTIMARGAYPHDIFDKDEKGYIWGKEGEIYTMTKGLKNQPNLKQKQKKRKKKSLDI